MDVEPIASPLARERRSVIDDRRKVARTGRWAFILHYVGHEASFLVAMMRRIDADMSMFWRHRARENLIDQYERVEE